jgi:hypothetical protein
MGWTYALLAQSDEVNVGPAGLGLGLFCVFGVLTLLATVFWLWMLIDALVSEPTTNDKILWFLVIFFLQIIGALIYFFVRRQARSGARTARVT